MEIKNNPVIMHQEVDFCTDFIDKSNLYIIEIKYNNEIKALYRKQYGNRGYYLGFIGQILNLVDMKKAKEFAKQLSMQDKDKVTPLISISVSPKDAQEMKQVYAALKQLALKYNLLLYDFQKGDYIDINESADLPPNY